MGSVREREGTACCIGSLGGIEPGDTAARGSHGGPAPPTELHDALIGSVVVVNYSAMTSSVMVHGMAA